MDELNDIVQNMVAAGESEENIALVIKSYTGKTNDSANVDPSVESDTTGSESEEPLSAWQSIKNSFLKASERLGDITEFWGADEGMGSALDIATNSTYSLFAGQKNIDDFVEKYGEDSSLTAGLGTKETLEAIEKYKKEQEESSFKTKQITESIKKGDITGAGAGIVEAVINGVSSVAYFLGTGGAGIYAENVAENYINYNEQKAKNLGISMPELIKQGKADNLAPVGLGALSVALERIGFGKMAKVAGGKDIVKNISGKLIYNKAARNVANVLAAGGTEFATEILQHATDKVNEEIGRTAGTENETEVLSSIGNAIFSQEGLEAGLQGFFGGSGMAGAGRSLKALNTIRTTVDGDLVNDKIEELSKKRVKLNAETDAVVKEGIQLEINDIEQTIADSIVKGNVIYDSLTDEQLSEIENLTELADAAAYKITELNKKLRFKDIDQAAYDVAAQGFTKQYEQARQGLIDMNLEKNIEFAKKEAEARGLKFKVYETTKALQQAMNRLKTSKENKQKFKDNKGNVHGFAIGDQIFINKEVSSKLGAINVGAHEFLHPLFNKLVGDVKTQGKYVRQFKRAMTSSQRRFMDKEMRNRGYTSPVRYNTEYINVFSDALRKKRINYDKTVFEKVGGAVLGILKPKGYSNASFDSGRDVYNFIKEYDKSIEEGKLTKAAKAAIGDVDLTGVKLEGVDMQESREILDLTDALDAAEDAYAADPNNPTLEKNVELAEKALDEAEERAISGAPKPKVVAPKPNKEKKKPKVTTKKKSTAPLKKETAKSKKILDDIGNDPKGYDKNNPKIYEVLSGIIKSKSKAFRTAGGNVVNLATLPQFEMDNMIQETLAFLAPMITKFNPKVNDSLYGYLNSQLSNKMRSALKSGRVTEAEFTEDVTDAKGVAGDAGVIRNFADEKQIAPENLIKASKVISTEVRNKLASDLKTWSEVNGIDFDFFNFGDVDPNITIQVDGKDVKILNEVLKELFPGVDPEKFLDSRTMFTSGEASIVLGKLAENDQELVELFINLLPRGAVMPKGKNKAIVKDANYGKSTKLDGSILKNFYNKGTERFTKKAGLTPFTLKDNIRYSDVHQAFGMDSSGNKLNYQRAKSGIVLASAYKMLGKLILNEVIRTDLGLTAEQQMNVGAGKGDLQFSLQASKKEKAAINRLPDSLVEILQDFKNKVFSSFTGTRLSNKGGREDVNKEFRRLQEKYAKNKDFLLILEKIDEVKANLQSMGWWEQEENLVKTFIKVSKLIKGITITQRKVNTNANELDYKFKFLGKEFVVEVKKNTKAILGSIGLHATKKNGKYDFKLDDKYKSVFSEKQIQDIVRALKEQRLNYLTTLDEIVRNSDNEYGLTEKDFKIEVLDNNRVRTRISRKLKVLLNINLTTEDKNAFPELKPGALSWVIYSNKPKNKLLVDLTSVDKYYTQKGGNIINFSDVGAFAIGDPVKNEFSGVLPNLSDVKLKDGKSPKVEIASRWKIAGKGDEFTLYQIAQLKLDLVENQRALENNSDYNLQITENLEEVLNSLYNNIQLSQTENAIQTYNKENKADLQLSKSMNSEFNQMIEKKSGIDARGTISKYKASVMGRKKGRFQFFIPPGAEDFEGLMYKLLDKGKLGEQQKEWFKKTLFDPFARGINEFDTYKLQVANSVRQLKKSLKDIPKELGKRDPKTDFKYEDAVRVYLWQLNGHEIKGISESDIKALVDIVKNSPNLKRFARQLNRTMGGYPKPQDSWLAGTITTDAINMVNTLKRAEFLETWQQNADIIFSEDNLNKLEATFGEDYVEALKDSLYRMKSGRNRPSGANKLTNRFMNWVNDSVATIMFFNTRSALLQTLSTVNFINWGDNNPLLAAKAFSNQKQFWGDFAMLFNSDFLKSRRTGLKNDVNADEIANAAATQTNKVKAALAILLKAGFLPTQMADSFAIAMGGASFYRNRVNTYMQKGEGKPGMGRLAAEEQAFLDFQEIAEATQQSSRPDRVSQQQASPLGRIILAFANTPMQYMRLTKKAFLDLKNGRGSAKENITKMLYYAAIQNVIFSSLQAALFATLFDDEEEEETKKKGVRVANTMLDSMLRGLGIYGAVASTVKNIAMEIDKQSKKDRPDYSEAAVKALDLSPPISSKIRKGRSAGRAFSYKTTREKMVGFGLDNPAYYAVGQIASATANIPLDRAIGKANHVRLAFAQETKFWQSLSLLLGFSEWDLNMIEKDKKKSKFGQKMNWKKRNWKQR